MKRSAERVIGATEAGRHPVVHVDMHRLSAGRTGRPPLLAEATGPFQAELPAADLADVSFLAVRGFPVPVDGIGSAARAEDPVDQFTLHLFVPVRSRPRGGLGSVRPDADECLG